MGCWKAKAAAAREACCASCNTAFVAFELLLEAALPIFRLVECLSEEEFENLSGLVWPFDTTVSFLKVK